MALLKLGGLVTNISGRIGGNILGTSPNGSYIKSNSYSQQHPSPSQSLQRTQLYPITQLWSTLNPTQKALWEAEVTNYPYVNRVGDSVYYSGYQLFCLLNLNLQLIGSNPLSVPATYEALVSFTYYSGGNPDDYVDMIVTSASDNDYACIYSMPPATPTNSYKPSKLLFMGAYPLSSPETHCYWTTPYSERWGLPFSLGNQWTTMKTVNSVTGITSALATPQLINYS